MFGFSSFSELPFSSQPTSQNQLEAEAGLFVLTGSAASFTLGKTIVASPGSYTITGGDATFIYNQVIYAGSFAFSLTGQAASLAQTHILECDAGSFAITGNNAEFLRSKGITGETGSYLFFGENAELNYRPIPVVVVESKGGIGKKQHKKHQEEKRSREELEAIVKREFDILDGTYVPEAAEAAKEVVLPQIKQLDLSQYEIAVAQVNALLLQAKIKAAEYEAELDDEEALMMLL